MSSRQGIFRTLNLQVTVQLSGEWSHLARRSLQSAYVFYAAVSLAPKSGDRHALRFYM